jgi:hypothetical protein
MRAFLLNLSSPYRIGCDRTNGDQDSFNAQQL